MNITQTAFKLASLAMIIIIEKISIQKLFKLVAHNMLHSHPVLDNGLVCQLKYAWIGLCWFVSKQFIEKDKRWI